MRGSKITRQHVGLGGVVAVALQLGRRREAVPDAQVCRGEQAGDGQIRVGGGVTEPQLHARGAAALGRDAQHRAAVVQAPVDQPGRQGVGAEPLVGVDRWVVHGSQRRGVGQHAGDRRPGDVGQPVLAVRIIEDRLAVVVDGREVDVEAGAALVVERLGHERRHPAGAAGQLLDAGLEPERAVRRAERLGMPQVDLELAAGELVVGSHHVDVVGGQRAQRRQQRVLRVALEAGDVDVAGALAVAAPALGAGRVGLEHVELQFGADHWPHSEFGELLDDALEHRARDSPPTASRRGCRDRRCTWATPGSHGTGRSVARSGNATMSGRPADRPPSMSTTSPSGEVPYTERQNATPSPTVRPKCSTSRSRPRSVPIRSL